MASLHLLAASARPYVLATEWDIPLWLASLLAALLAGMAIGHYLSRRATLAPSELRRLTAMLSPLAEWTRGLADDMSQYRSVVDGMAGLLREAPSQLVASQQGMTVGLLSSVVEANEHLQERLQEAEQLLKRQADTISLYMSEARTDALTRLPNRRAFDEELSRCVAQWRRHGHPLSVVLVDVDHFKQFNDAHGHPAGDQALRDVSELLHTTMRESDFVARYGGEELAVILPATDLTEAKQAATRARQSIEKASFLAGNRPTRITVSLGVAELHAAETADALVGRADAALYAAKRAGRNRAYWHDGHRCLPVDPPVAATAESAATACDAHSLEAHAADASFARICQDLRRRLKEVGTAIKDR